jgi:hypothetical protein
VAAIRTNRTESALRGFMFRFSFFSLLFSLFQAVAEISLASRVSTRAFKLASSALPLQLKSKRQPTSVVVNYNTTLNASIFYFISARPRLKSLSL